MRRGGGDIEGKKAADGRILGLNIMVSDIICFLSLANLKPHIQTQTRPYYQVMLPDHAPKLRLCLPT